MNKTFILSMLFPIHVFAQHPVPVMQVLEQSGEHRNGLEQLLSDYRMCDNDKYEAACFLIANLPYNSQPYTLHSVDSRLISLLHKADSSYYELVRERCDTALYNERFNKQVLAPVDQTYRKMMEQQHRVSSSMFSFLIWI